MKVGIISSKIVSPSQAPKGLALIKIISIVLGVLVVTIAEALYHGETEFPAQKARRWQWQQ